MRKKLNKQAIRSLPWALLESVTVVAGNVTSALILARFLEPDEFGAAAAALAIVTIVDLMVTAPFSDTLVQRHRIDMLHLDSAFWAMMVVGVLGSLLCGLLAYPLSLVYQDPALAPLIGVCGLTCLVSGVSGLPSIVLTRKLRIKQLALRTVAGRLLNVVLTIVLAIGGFGAWSIVFGTLAGNTASGLVTWLFHTRRPRFRCSIRHLRELIEFGTLTTIEGLLWLATFRLFIAAVGFFHGLSNLGYLNLAVRITDALTTVIHGMTLRFGLPLFSAIQHDDQTLRGAFAKGTRLSLSLAAPVFLGTAVVSSDLIAVVFGNKWLPAADLLTVLCLGGLIASTRIFVTPYLKAKGYAAAVALMAALAAVTALTATFVTRDSTMTAVSFAWTARLLITVPVGTYLLRATAKICFREQLAPLQLLLLSVLVMGVMVLLLQAQLAQYDPAIRLPVDVIAGCLIYGLMLNLVDRDTVSLSWGVLRDVMRR